MILIIVSLVHAIYIIYMLNYFKTKYSLAHPLTLFDNNLIKHPIGTSEEPISNVCRLGNTLSWYLSLFIIIRAILIHFKGKIVIKYFRIISLVVLIFGVILSMMNFNVVVYLIPHFILEILLLKINYVI